MYKLERGDQPSPSSPWNITKAERSERRGVPMLETVSVLCFTVWSYLLWLSWYPCLNLSGQARLLWLYNRESRELEAELAKGLLKQAGFGTTDLFSDINYTWGKFIWIFAQLEISFYCRQGNRGAKEEGEILLMLPYLLCSFFFLITGCFVALKPCM